jgi:hypothetical protein
MSSTAVTIAGIAARALLCDSIVQCRLSTPFVEKHMARKVRLSVAEIVISASLNYRSPASSSTCEPVAIIKPLSRHNTRVP